MQCKALRDSAREIQNFDVAYFMASVDTLEDNTAFAAEHEANFPILADPSKEMVDAYGALMGVGFANRLTRVLLSALVAVFALGGQFAAAVEEGDKAPDFSLQASDGATYTLSQFAGDKPVVIAFFPKAFTGG